LIRLEEQRGWATIGDEGSQDKFLQSIIDGARRSVESWKNSQGSDYRQGKGRGLITNNLETRLNQSRENYAVVHRYVEDLNSLGLSLNARMPVQEQFEIVNRAFVGFPLGEISLINFDGAELGLTTPPSTVPFAETAENRQQALMIVIEDLYRLDSLSIFALLLAFSVDFIVMLMALAGGYAIQNMDYLMERLEEDSVTRLKGAPLDDQKAFGDILDGNISRYRKGTQYSLDLMTLMSEYKAARQGLQIALKKKSSQLKKAPPHLEVLEASSRPQQPIRGNSEVINAPIKEQTFIAETKRGHKWSIDALTKNIRAVTPQIASRTIHALKSFAHRLLPRPAKRNSRLVMKKYPKSHLPRPNIQRKEYANQLSRLGRYPAIGQNAASNNRLIEIGRFIRSKQQQIQKMLSR